MYPVYLIGLYLACELTANITASKVTVVGPFAVPAAVYIFTITYTLLDVINHTLGSKEARRVVMAGFLGNVVLAVYSWLAVSVPPAPFWSGQAGYAQVLGATPRVVTASLLAYLISSNIDVSAYVWLSKKVAPWARVIISNAFSLAADTMIFITIAFVGLIPIWPLMVGQYVVKMVVTVISVPLIYLTRYTLKGGTSST